MGQSTGCLRGLPHPLRHFVLCFPLLGPAFHPTGPHSLVILCYQLATYLSKISGAWVREVHYWVALFQKWLPFSGQLHWIGGHEVRRKVWGTLECGKQAQDMQGPVGGDGEWMGVPAAASLLSVLRTDEHCGCNFGIGFVSSF